MNKYLYMAQNHATCGLGVVFLFFRRLKLFVLLPGPTVWQNVPSRWQDLLKEVDANGDGSIDFEASAAG